MKKLGGWLGLAALSMVAVACTANVESSSDSADRGSEPTEKSADPGASLHDELLPVKPGSGGGGGGPIGGTGSSGSSGGTTSNGPPASCGGVPYPGLCDNGSQPGCIQDGPGDPWYWACTLSGVCNACFPVSSSGSGSSSGGSGSGGVIIFKPVHID